MDAPIVLLTDFGSSDPYVGIMKGVILTREPEARIVDLTHGVPPQDVRAGAFVLRASVAHFPKGSRFICVVDPGVGGRRKLIWGRSKDHEFWAPDNGLLSWVGLVEARELAVPAGASATFHGRDVLARLPRGGRKTRWKTLREPGREIVLLDRFGNAVTGLRRAKTVRYGGLRLELKRTYGDVEPGKPLAYVGSWGYVELAVRDGSFAALTGAKPGDEVHAD